MGHIIRVAPQPQGRQPRPMPNIDYITAKGFKSIASIEKRKHRLTAAAPIRRSTTLYLRQPMHTGDPLRCPTTMKAPQSATM